MCVREEEGEKSAIKNAFFCSREQQRQEAASTSPLILFSSQYKLWWTRGASNGGIKNVLKNTGVPPMCDTCRPALGPLCMTHRGGGKAGGTEGGGGDGNRGEKAPILYTRQKGSGGEEKCRKLM